MSDAPLRDVVRAFESTGPKGGREIVHVLECGCWVINRRKTPAKQLRCISCRVREEQGGEGRHGAPRVEDIAWQAFTAGMRWWVTIGRFVYGDVPIEPTDTTQKAFRGWWAKR